MLLMKNSIQKLVNKTFYNLSGNKIIKCKKEMKKMKF